MRKTLIATICIFLFSAACRADTLVLKTGQELKGKIIGQTEGGLKFDSGLGIPVLYLFDEISRVDKAPFSPGIGPHDIDSATGYVSFPRDRGLHFGVQEEWWAAWGDLVTDDAGSRLGYYLTFFKLWSVSLNRFLYIAALSIIDPPRKEYHFTETFSPFLEQEASDGDVILELKEAAFRFDSAAREYRLYLDTGPLGLDLTLKLGPRPQTMLYGDLGLLSSPSGFLGLMYAHPYVDTSGTLRVRQRNYTVNGGKSWLHHQWGELGREENPVNAFNLLLGAEGIITFFVRRDAAGNLFDAQWTYYLGDGNVRSGDGGVLLSKRVYRDKGAAVSYPVEWVLKIPEIKAEFEIKPVFDEQSTSEQLMYPFWAGMCTFTGNIGGIPTGGTALATLTGYEKGRLSLKEKVVKLQKFLVTRYKLFVPELKRKVNELLKELNQ